MPWPGWASLVMITGPPGCPRDPWHLAVYPDLGIVVDHDLKSDGRTRDADVSDPFRNSDVDAIPVKADLGCRAPLVKSRRIDGFPLRIVEVCGSRMRSVVVGPDRC